MKFSNAEIETLQAKPPRQHSTMLSAFLDRHFWNEFQGRYQTFGNSVPIHLMKTRLSHTGNLHP
jgi:hypothetical protein